MEPRGYYEDPEQDDKKPEPASAADLHALKAKVAALTEMVATLDAAVGTLTEQK